MKKTLIACLIASILATSLTGCGKSDAEKKQEAQALAYQQMMDDQVKQKQLDQEATEAAAAQQAADDKELSDVIAELKKGDPLIRDAYYGYNEKGDRVLHVVRDNPPQPQPQQPQYQQGSNGQPVIINNQPAQASGGSSESIWPLAAGVGAGMLLANAMNSGGGYDRYRDSHRDSYSSRNWDNDNDYRRQRTTVVNQYHTTNVTNVKTAYKNPESPVAQKLKTQGYYTAPARPTPVSSGYAQTKQIASPTANRSVQAKPATNSYWDSSQKASPAKAAPATPAANSYWGSSSKASPSTTQSRSSGYSSGSSGSSFKSSPSASRSSSSFSSSSRSSSSRR